MFGRTIFVLPSESDGSSRNEENKSPAATAVAVATGQGAGTNTRLAVLINNNIKTKMQLKTVECDIMPIVFDTRTVGLLRRGKSLRGLYVACVLSMKKKKMYNIIYLEN